MRRENHINTNKNKKLKLYKDIFLWSAIPYGIILGLVFAVLNVLQTGQIADILIGLLAGVVGGIVFGIIMSLALVFLYNRPVSRMHGVNAVERWAVHQKRMLELNLPYDRVYDLCLESLDSIKKCKIQMDERAKGKIQAKAGITWSTWGDIISFEI